MNRLLLVGFALLLSMPVAQAQSWKARYRCDDGHVRVDYRTDPLTRLEDQQIVIEPSYTMSRLRAAGAINETDLNAKGELVLPLSTFHILTAETKRDDGKLYYFFDTSLQYPNGPRNLTISVAWSNTGFNFYLHRFVSFEVGCR